VFLAFKYWPSSYASYRLLVGYKSIIASADTRDIVSKLGKWQNSCKFKASGSFRFNKDLNTICGIWNVICSHIIKGESIVLVSNKSGWLQTFLSYISTFIILKKSAVANVPCVLSQLMYSSYNRRCRLERVHCTICSIFSGNYFSTSLFIRLSKKGRRID